MKKIKVLREAAGLTQKDVASELGVKVQLISNIERGMSAIPPKHFGKLAKILHAKPEWFIKELVKSYENRVRMKVMNG